MATSQAFAVQPPPQIERFVNADPAAMFLGVSSRNLLQKVRAGKIPTHPLEPRAQKKEWRFKLSELDSYLGNTSAVRRRPS